MWWNAVCLQFTTNETAESDKLVTFKISLSLPVSAEQPCKVWVSTNHAEMIAHNMCTVLKSRVSKNTDRNVTKTWYSVNSMGCVLGSIGVWELPLPMHMLRQVAITYAYCISYMPFIPFSAINDSLLSIQCPISVTPVVSIHRMWTKTIIPVHVQHFISSRSAACHWSARASVSSMRADGFWRPAY